ncbi:hypothetical protein TrRE_jg10126 [Triparma retinervis]|uniref:Uncharacterized protein n=1 Tax=Triparma retinervis TaxID=2557542 RepID=A0A9W7EE87_9STRA|nr:hypothetical protein TrRE_jg10126 [Triparma retinervis]
MCGKRMTSYVVNVESSSKLINGILNVLGGFPQDTCSEKSKVNKEMECNGKPCDACSEAWAEEDCTDLLVPSNFKVSKAMVRLVNFFGVTFKVMASGKVEGEEGEIELWCLDFRKPSEEDGPAFFIIESGKAGKKKKKKKGGGEL